LNFALDGISNRKLLTFIRCPLSSHQAVWNTSSLHFREWWLLQVSLLSSSFSIFFYIKTSMEESSRAFIIGEFSLFKKLFILLSICANLLSWWRSYENWFSNVGFLGFLAKQIIGTLQSQIKFKLNVLLTLLMCWHPCNVTMCKCRIKT
jgi:hypothetical protein